MVRRQTRCIYGRLRCLPKRAIFARVDSAGVESLRFESHGLEGHTAMNSRPWRVRELDGQRSDACELVDTRGPLASRHLRYRRLYIVALVAGQRSLAAGYDDLGAVGCRGANDCGARGRSANALAVLLAPPSVRRHQSLRWDGRVGGSPDNTYQSYQRTLTCGALARRHDLPQRSTSTSTNDLSAGAEYIFFSVPGSESFSR